ncbi:hypothetical protein [Flavobacterium sp.]|uniref:hypothetical protein n=1 Tax=Flavobacterium sp. TaxID=239 RepID=UPI004047B429
MNTPFTNNKKVDENINSIFNNKGIFAAVAEKTINNFKSKYNLEKQQQPNLHYFAVGHTFKNIDTKKIFDYQLTVDEKDTFPTKYLSLQQENFSFLRNERLEGTNKYSIDKLYNLIDNIRNINAHYIHQFGLIEIQQIDKQIITFIKESFEVALIRGVFAKEYGKRKEEKEKEKKEKVDFLSNEDKDKILLDILSNLDSELIQFTKEIFYQTLFVKNEKEWGAKTEDYKQKKNFLESHLKTKDDWIDWILFNNVEEDMQWSLNPKGNNQTDNHIHEVLTISKGIYLSFEGCLFIMSMFLYANEANYLIPKLKGFKKNKNPQDTSKLEVFRFYAKKFKSQDVDSEHNQLVKFRDVIQYLNKYPVRWNAVLHTEAYYVEELKNRIIKTEIKKYYGEDASDEFVIFAKHTLWGSKNVDKTIEVRFQKISKENKDKYNLIINQNPDYTNNIKSILEIEKEQKKLYKKKNTTSEEDSKLKKYQESLIKLRNKNKKIEENRKRYTNENTEKLKKRIESNLIYISNGRNNDCFMQFATRYLAEVNYFGKEAQFKMYENYFSGEEQQALRDKKEKLSKKDFDKLHYHGGKLTHFSTYENHLKNYPDWDMPFVIQNNAIYVKIPGINYQKEASFCIQRDLLNYLLEHALVRKNPENEGKHFLINYFNFKNKEFQEGVALLKEKAIDDTIAIDKTALKKIFPKRLLHQYSPPVVLKEKVLPFKKYLDNAIDAEVKYESQKKQAKEENRLDLFLKKNKGKQFKLKFIFRAWQLMFFKEQYLKNKEGQAILDKTNSLPKNKEHEFGHHKKFNITREEYNLFSKWLFAMDEIPSYKKQLENLLNEKHFFEDMHFKRMFANANTLNDFYIKTKQAFENWLPNQTEEEKATRFQLDNYLNMMEVGNIHINLSHFLIYAERQKKIRKEGKNIIRPITKNAKYLHESFYEIDLQHSDSTNIEKNLFRKLYKNRLEDCLLYEIALRYLQPDKELRAPCYNNLSEILIQEIDVNINDDNNNAYSIRVPFKDLEKFAQIQYLDNLNKKFSFLKRIPNYLSQVENYKEKVHGLNDMIEDFKANKRISLAQISMLNNHLITQQGRFTQCILAMEEYFIWKHQFTISQSIQAKEQNRIVMYDIPTLKDYFNNDRSRNTAFHFDLPMGETYKSSFLKKEKEFANTELKGKSYKKLSDCPYMLQKTVKVFMNQMHDEIKINFKNNDTQKKKEEERKNAETRFFNKIKNY